jgi:hypothetical protein
VIGLLLDVGRRQLNFSFNGNESASVVCCCSCVQPQFSRSFVIMAQLFNDVEPGEGLYPMVAIAQTSTEIELNFGRQKFAYPPDPSRKFCPLEHPGIRASTWIERSVSACFACV